ncbi:MAG TPA: hypothetical protein VGG99_17335 [Acetobacteraceae bacterium]|jgi:hypothetical protein
MRTLAVLAAFGSVIVLCGCGSSQPGRTTGGAATGAATGAAIGVIGGPPGMLVGALIGGAAGGATGAATKPRDFNLGPPVWQRGGG